MLTQGSVLKVTANGTTTSPVVRGVWVLDRILDKPPKPPPADVPKVEPDIRGATTIREQFAKHRQVASCASCHKQIDPPGYALENYDPIAAFSYWRRGELGLRPWLASLRTVDEAAWFARDDLRPFGLMCLRMGWRMATRRLDLPQGRASSTDVRFSGGRAAARAGRRYADADRIRDGLVAAGIEIQDRPEGTSWALG